MSVWPQRFCGARALTGAAALALLALLSAAGAVEGATLEFAVKAAYLSRFGEFVAWPASAFKSPESAVNLCVAGAASVDEGLAAAVAGRHIGRRPIVVRWVESVTPASGCHILYVGGHDAERVERTLNAVRGASVLTVTDASGTATPSIIRFVIKDDHVRFAIDERAAVLNGITISSKLLSLALSVTSPDPTTP